MYKGLTSPLFAGETKKEHVGVESAGAPAENTSRTTSGSVGKSNAVDVGEGGGTDINEKSIEVAGEGDLVIVRASGTEANEPSTICSETSLVMPNGEPRTVPRSLLRCGEPLLLLMPKPSRVSASNHG